MSGIRRGRLAREGHELDRGPRRERIVHALRHGGRADENWGAGVECQGQGIYRPRRFASGRAHATRGTGRTMQPMEEAARPALSATPDIGQETPAMTVSVVICTYSEARRLDLIAAVESVRSEASAGTHEIVLVVDHNASLADELRRTLPDCVVVENRHSKGLSGARNTGVEVAGGDIVLFLDDDAVACDKWITSHAAAYDDVDVIGTAGLVRPAWDPGLPPSWWPDLYDWVIGCNDRRIEPAGASVRNPTGANMGFRRAKVVEVGGFSDRLGRTSDAPLGCEETELGIRLIRTNPAMRIVSVPEALCLHRVPKERVTWRYFRRRCVAEGRSKAVVARMTGIGAATSAERRYTGRSVPAAVSTAVRTGHYRRALAIVAGVSFAVFGFLPGFLKPADDGDERRHAATTITVGRGEQ